MDTLILVSLALPLLLALLVALPRSRAVALALAPGAPLPALVLALAAREPLLFELPDVLTGLQLGVDDTGRVFLLFTSLIWLAAGWYARGWLADDPRRARFAVFFLLTQAGNLGACLALDAAGFYAFYALMSFAAYGLVAHDNNAVARRAGRVYLVLAVAGEMLILSGLLLALGLAPDHPWAVACLLLGFGVKVGLPLLHVSLPLAYAAAPAPAAAVLAGAMIKAGLLGWLRFLPLGDAALPDAGQILMLAGGAAIVGGSVIGLMQRQPGAILAYSSVAQMGHFALGVGAGLVAPELWPLIAAALVVYAAHHALAKAALFLGLGVVARHGASFIHLAGLALPALALAGAPFSSGMLAKLGLKDALAPLPAPWADVLPVLLAVGVLGTALLMARFLVRVREAPTAGGAPASLWAPWLLMLAGVAGMTAGLAPSASWTAALQPGVLLYALWPILAALVLTVIALRLRLRAPQIPAGDLLVPFERLLATLARRLAHLRPPALPTLPTHAARRPPRLESRLRAWPLAGALWLALLAGFIVLLAR
ncbi:MAG: proton-conducting transporter membrane subunit [Thiobacillus sp.]|uniref:proton-conducting transporter transmembrane domain-containing protein n=1 Tax=Thiobacillus sp. TaxID=924 RepID=UPI0027333FEE|nr:proton-conducting transporter membrane subunit [Thiobacillus sp.]MDP3586342.1 proton-conducting transporter membrane subunit [Thiobacillus sp.]